MSIQSTAAYREAPLSGKPLSVPVKTMCELLGIGNTTAWGLIRENRVKTFMIGRKRLVVFASIEQLMTSNETKAERKLDQFSRSTSRPRVAVSSGNPEINSKDLVDITIIESRQPATVTPPSSYRGRGRGGPIK